MFLLVCDDGNRSLPLQVVELPADERPSYNITTLIQYDRTPAVKEYRTGTVPWHDKVIFSYFVLSTGTRIPCIHLVKSVTRKYDIYIYIHCYILKWTLIHMHKRGVWCSPLYNTMLPHSCHQYYENVLVLSKNVD